MEFLFDPERTGWTNTGVFAEAQNTLVKAQGLTTEIVEDPKDERLLILDFVEANAREPKPVSLTKAFDNMTKSNGK